jgi:hypothetical protein
LAPRRSNLPPPQSAVLTVDAMRVGIAQLNRRIAELEAFDPQSVQRRDAPEVEALETAIDEALAKVFGLGTTEYIRYQAAATLDHGPRVMQITPSWIAARGGGTHQQANMHEVHRYLAEGKARSLVWQASKHGRQGQDALPPKAPLRRR